MRLHRLLGGCGLVLACLLGALVGALSTFFGAGESGGADPTLWPESERAFFQDGPGLLLSDERRRELLALDPEARRLAIEDFLGLDPIPETPANELQEGIARRLRLVEAENLSPLDARARLLFLNGPPAERKILQCGAAFRPLEIWAYRDGGDGGGVSLADESGTGGEAPPAHRLVVFEPAPGAAWRLWTPADAKSTLYTSEMEYWLEQWEELNGNLIRAVRFDLQLCKEARLVDRATGIRGLTDAQRGRPRPEEVERFVAPPADLAAWSRAAAATEPPEAAKPLGAEWAGAYFPAARGQRVVARVVVKLPADAPMEVATDGDKPELRLRIDGLVEQDGEIFDRFSVRFKLPPPEASTPVGLALERALRPGRAVVVRLQVADEVSGRETRLARGLAVPAEAQPVVEPPVPEEVIV